MKIYKVPKIEYTTVSMYGNICGVSGDNNSGQAAITTNPGTGGGSSDDLFGSSGSMKRRVFF